MWNRERSTDEYAMQFVRNFEAMQNRITMKIVSATIFLLFSEYFDVYLAASSNITLDRTKRWLMYPYGGQAKVVVGVAWPIMLGSRQRMTCSVNFQFEFTEPTDVAIFHTYPPIVSSRSLENRDVNKPSDRMTTYSRLEEMLDRKARVPELRNYCGEEFNDVTQFVVESDTKQLCYGMDGHHCLLRNICENAMDPIDHDGNGIFGKLLQILLSPDYGDGEVDKDLDAAYVDAQLAGYYGVDCFSLYPECPYGSAILDLVSAFL